MTKLEALADAAVAEAKALGGEAAPGVPRQTADAVNTKASRELYASRQKIHPRLAHGTYRTIKWIVMAVTLGIYYVLPWLRWPRAESLPDQMVLLDFEGQRLFFGPLEIWPQEFYLVTGILVISALALFLVTSLAGRVWCGYACPQTVWTDLMVMVERFWQGDRNQRIKLDKEAWSANWIWRKGGTHITWALISVLTGGALVFYFRDAPTLAYEFATLTAPAIAWIFLGVFALTTYLLGGLAREQVCTYMCPWPRIQGAMFDADSLLVTYRGFRGEPRGPHKRGETWEGRGDCIDCKLCVAVCPAGIDIRDGAQLECIQCALCIDACNEVMAKLGRPKNLIAYDTFHNIEAETKGLPSRLRFVRPRTILYAGMIAIVSVVMAMALWGRTTLEVNVLRDRNPLFVQLSDGGVRNGYTLKILNKRQESRSFRITADGLPGAVLSIVGFEGEADPVIVVPTDDLRALKIYVSVPAARMPELTGDATDFALVVTDTNEDTVSRNTTNFRRPAQ